MCVTNFYKIWTSKNIFCALENVKEMTLAEEYKRGRENFAPIFVESCVTFNGNMVQKTIQ